jgi:murein DD-endopeptidase MepM/ murein hydrolase activator NlpD
VAATLAALVVLVSALPVSAMLPVRSRTSYVSQWSHAGHRAIDIAAKSSSRVVPIRDGKVVFAGWKSNCGGRQVFVYHGNGLYSAYYHLRRVTTHRVERVTAGSEVIGYVGRTGCARGPHLHIEVWRGYPWHKGSRPLNPWKFVKGGSFLPRRYT